MQRQGKILIVGTIVLGAVIGLLLAAVAATQLLANREMVRSLLAAKTAQAIGGSLDYDRLTINLLPLPHVEAEGIDLQRPDAFAIRAAELSIYPRLLPLMAGRLRIRRMVVEAPDVRLAGMPAALSEPESPPPQAGAEKRFGEDIQAIVGGLFGFLAAIEPNTDLLIQEGTVTLALADAPDLWATDVQLYGENDNGRHFLSLECRTAVAGRLEIGLHADSGASTARGTITADDLNLRPILHYASLPGGLLTADTHARANASFTVAGVGAVNGRFHLRLPDLTVVRNSRQLDLTAVNIAGDFDAGASGLHLRFDRLQSARPAVNLSAGARIRIDQETNRQTIELQAEADRLEVAVAGQAIRAIAGDLEAVRTAFAVAREGIVTDAGYAARWEEDGNGYRTVSMNAAGHISQGRITIPGIDADLERMDGDIVYRDQQVRFTNASGHFTGATFETLAATIDWQTDATLSITSPAVNVEAATLSNWLLSFEELAGIRQYVRSVDGVFRLSLLAIDGPLTDPAKWDFKVRGTPETVRLTSSLFPFEARFSGGTIAYVPGSEEATNVAIEFLDAAVTASYQTNGLMEPESIVGTLDGTLGPEAIAWLNTMLPLPTHLQMKPPVDLYGVKLTWNNIGETSLVGTVQTAGGINIVADGSFYPETWHLRRIEFSDGSSTMTASARKDAERVEVTFSGNVEKATADRILADNRILAGRLEGDFRAIYDIGRPMHAAFAGQLSGQGVRILQVFPDPVEIDRFSIDGRAGQLTIAPSTIRWQNSRMIVDGTVRNRSGDVHLNLNVDADRMDAALLQSIRSAGRGSVHSAPKQGPPVAPTLSGTVTVQTDEFSYGRLTWSPVEAVVTLGEQEIGVQINRSDLCGITATGNMAFTSDGLRLHISPRAESAPLEATAECLWDKSVEVQGRYDLEGDIRLPEPAHDPLQQLTGRLTVRSQNGRILYSNVMTKIVALLNVTEALTGGSSDVIRRGYGYTNAHVKMRLGDGKLHLDEILLDGNSLKMTGRGSIDVNSQNVDIKLLAAPLKTVDRVVSKLPVIGYIAGGSLISIPLRVRGKVDNVTVVTMPPSDVGKGLLNLMGRTLKEPFKLIEQGASLATDTDAPPRN